MATITVNTLEFVSALRALIPISKQATLYSGEKERNAATIAARITPAKKLALITGNSALGAIASVGIEQAVELLTLIRERFAERLCSFELISRFALELSSEYSGITPPTDAPWHILLELTDSLSRGDLADLLAETLMEHGFDNSILAQSESGRRDMWTLRENISAAQRRLGASIKHDIAMPIARVGEFVVNCGHALQAAFAGIDIVVFGHLGDGSLHYNTFLPQTVDNGVYAYEDAVNKIVYENVLACDGTIAAEHGIGQVKNHWLPRVRSTAEIALMRAVKAAFDPHNMMNPNKLLPEQP